MFYIYMVNNYVFFLVLQVSVKDCIPNSWEMFNWDIYQPLVFTMKLGGKRWEHGSYSTIKRLGGKPQVWEHGYLSIKNG